MYEIKRFEFLLEAMSPICHAQESIGNHSVHMRRKIRQPDGRFALVPIITGDSMRHQLREAVAYAFLDAAGLLHDGALSEAALRLLFAGGMVTGRGDASTVKLDEYREMCELVPALGLLGGCAGNRVLEGRTIVEDAVLVCAESKALLPAWIVEEAGALETARAHVEIAQRVRMDPTLSPTKRKLLSDGAQNEVSHRLLESEAAHAGDDAAGRDGSKSSMMPRTHESVIAGSLLSWAVQVTCTSDLEVDTAHAMLAAFLSNARVGGKRGTGHGLVRARSARGIVVARPSERMESVNPNALAPRVGEQFRAHVHERRERIAKFLAGVNA